MSVQPDPQTQRALTALTSLHPWITDPTPTTAPDRRTLATAVRTSAEILANRAPGHSVELRIPPLIAVQCIPGPVHRRGTPPNIVECDPHTFLRLVIGVEKFTTAANTPRLDTSGTRAATIAEHLPLFPDLG